MTQSSGFAMVPAEVLATGNGYAIAVYAAIAQHADPKGVAWPSLKRLAEITGWSRPTVSKAVDVLIQSGALKRKHRNESGAKLSNKYTLPFHAKDANVQMETSLPTSETSLPRVGKEVSKGRKPRFHEQEPREQEPNKKMVPDGTLAAFPINENIKPAVQGDTPAHRIVNEWYRIVTGAPTDHGRDLGQAKALLKAGVTVENLPTFISWLRSYWAAKGGFDLSTAVRSVNAWNSTKSAPEPVKRFIV